MNVLRDKERGREDGGGEGVGGGMGPFSWLIGWVYLHVLAA